MAVFCTVLQVYTFEELNESFSALIQQRHGEIRDAGKEITKLLSSSNRVLKVRECAHTGQLAGSSADSRTQSNGARCHAQMCSMLADHVLCVFACSGVQGHPLVEGLCGLLLQHCH